MKKAIYGLLAVGLFGTSFAFVAMAGGRPYGNAKSTVCHKGGTPAEAELLIPETAVRAHLRHGDSRGPCGVPER